MSSVTSWSRCAGIALVALFLLSSPAAAFPRFGGTSGKSGCKSCHTWTKTPVTSPKGYTLNTSIHDVHRAGPRMNTDCELCHYKGGYTNPYTNTSEGTPSVKGFGCAGCHGRLYKGKAKAPGLRAYHAKKKIVVCASCHTNDPKPVAESVKPPYYGSSHTYAAFPCNNNTPPSEDWTFDGKGLDNDGDGLRDKADPDCKACGTVPTCASLGKDCGLVAVSCGGTLTCGDCNWPQTCGGGGTPNVCGAAKPDAGMPDAAKPDSAKPDAAKVPDLVQPTPDVATPDLPGPDLPGPDLPGSDLPVPDVTTKPDVASKPDRSKPDGGRHDAAPGKDAPRPDMGTPDLSPTPGPPADDSSGCQLRTGGGAHGIGLLLILLALRARRFRRSR